MMDFPLEERMRNYVKNKTDRLQGSQKWSATRTGILWVAALGSWLIEYSSTGEAILLLVVAAAWASIERTQSNLHIDLLASIKRDLDRDAANGLAGFSSDEKGKTQ